MKCEIVESSAGGKDFLYCRTHKTEAYNKYSCGQSNSAAPQPTTTTTAQPSPFGQQAQAKYSVPPPGSGIHNLSSSIKPSNTGHEFWLKVTADPNGKWLTQYICNCGKNYDDWLQWGGDCEPKPTSVAAPAPLTYDFKAWSPLQHILRDMQKGSK